MVFGLVRRGGGFGMVTQLLTMRYDDVKATQRHGTMRRLAVLFCLCFLFLTHAVTAAEDKKWICVANAATGFSYQNGKWVATNFNIKDSRYIVSKKQTIITKEMIYHVTKVGEEYGYECDKDSPSEYDWIICKGGDFRFNVNTLRYILAYLVGYTYWPEGDKDSDTPFIEIGTCSPF